MSVRLLVLLVCLACASPTDSANDLAPPIDIAETHIVHPKSVTVLVTPTDTAIYPHSTATFTAVAQDERGRVLIASGGWTWSTSGEPGKRIVITAVAYPPWRR
jgi:hypothetical protein